MASISGVVRRVRCHDDVDDFRVDLGVLRGVDVISVGKIDKFLGCREQQRSRIAAVIRMASRTGCPLSMAAKFLGYA